MSIAPDRLKEVAEQLRKGEDAPEESVRTLLSWFGAQRRGVHIVKQIRDALQALELRTDPDFRQVYIDGLVTFRLRSAGEGSADNQLEHDTLGDPTYRIGRLPAANNPPVSVAPDDSITRAVTLMVNNDFSQLPVMQGDRTVKGAISWESLGSRLALSQDPRAVRECTETPEIVDASEPLIEAVTRIAEHDYVLVQGVDHRITGIVTTSDLSLQFRALTEPFLLIGEIESHLRGLIDANCTKEDVRSARDPGDADREVTSAVDLTFGEYLRVLENPDCWSKLDLGLDRSEFVKTLERVREIRNDVMHFDPDGLAEDDVRILRSFVRGLQRLQRIGVFGPIPDAEG